MRVKSNQTLSVFDLQVSQEDKVIKAPRDMAFLVTLETQDQMVSG